MKLKYKIFLFTSNHITGNLVKLKLKSYGNDVIVHDCIQSSLNELDPAVYDIIVLNDSDKANPLISLAEERSIPLLFVNNGKAPALEEDRCTMGLSFTEEEFFHKVSYSVDYVENESNLPLETSVICHYGGDKSLAQKVVSSFLETWSDAIDEISLSFQSDNDRDLSRKIHSFKGVLSALGETEAAVTIRKMEILVKGRNRESAFKIYPELKSICQGFSEDLSKSSFLS